MWNMAINIPLDEPLPDNIRVYKNGALFDKNKGRIVGLRQDLAEKNTQITSENSGDLLAIRLERKRNLLRDAALSAVERTDLIDLHGSDAWIAEIGYNMQKKATNIDDPKMVDAARFMLKETGYGETEVQTPVQQVTDLTNAVTGLLKALRSNLRDSNAEVIDAE